MRIPAFTTVASLWGGNTIHHGGSRTLTHLDSLPMLEISSSGSSSIACHEFLHLRRVPGSRWMTALYVSTHDGPEWIGGDRTMMEREEVDADHFEADITLDTRVVVSSPPPLRLLDKEHVHVAPGVRLHYTSYGDQTAIQKILLIPGFTSSKEYWLDMVNALLGNPILDPNIAISTSSSSSDNDRSSFSSFPPPPPPPVHIIVMDNRGCGESTYTQDAAGKRAQMEPLTTLMMAKDALKVMTHVGWSTAHVVGNSMGGMIGTEIASIAPHRINSLTLIATTASSTSLVMSLLRDNLETIKTAFSKATSFKSEDEEDDWLSELIYPQEFLDAALPNNPKRTHREYLAEKVTDIKQRIGETHGSIVRSQGSAIAAHSVSPHRLRKIRNAGFPILILGGRLDCLVHVRNQKELYHALASDHTRLVIFEDGGHGIQQQYAQEIARLFVNYQL